MNKALPERHRLLIDHYIDDCLTEEEVAELEALLNADTDFRRRFIKETHQHGQLHWQLSGTEGISLNELEREAIPFPKNTPTRNWAGIAAAVAFLLFGVFVGTMWKDPSASPTVATSSPPKAFATLTETKNCRWESSSLPTAEGAALGKGTIKLASGIASLTFTSGAKVVLEAPAELELVDAMNCILHSGMLIANVPPPAQGFTVDTTQAKLVDYGTEFGVNVDPKDGTTQVQVFEGIVDVQHAVSGEIKRMTAGYNSSIDAAAINMKDARSQEPGMRNQPGTPSDLKFDTVITTAQGRGQDAFVQTGPQDIHTSETLLLLKNTEGPHFRRKAFLAFDLTNLEGRKIKEAEIQLTAEPTGYGFSSLVEDSVFAVYGINKDQLDGWNAADLSWETAPANAEGASEVAPEQTVHLGEFSVPQGVFHGAFTLSSKQLVQFLNDDTNGIISLILVRKTMEHRGGGLVHGFASSRHPTSAPPTLRLVTQ